MNSIALLTLLMAVASASLPPAPSQDRAALGACDSDLQIVMCGQIPFTNADERALCCSTYKPIPAEQIAVATEAVRAAAKSVPSLTVQGEVSVMSLDVSMYAVAPAMRGDLDRAPFFARRLHYEQWDCLQQAQVAVPTFPSAQNTTGYRVMPFNVPQLSSGTIKSVKDAARTRWPLQLKTAYKRIARNSSISGFIHPAGYAGPAELALLSYRLNLAAKRQQRAKTQPPSSTRRDAVVSNITEVSLYSMVSGENVPPKVYAGPWWPPVDCSPTAYEGPYPMQQVNAKWGGSNDKSAVGTCAPNYPPAAPAGVCAHVSFVELDGQMSYKQSLAYWATGDVRHAETAQRILDGWASTNTQWGLQSENGPLEAGWGCAALSRSMELLKSSRWTGFNSATYDRFTGWMNRVLMPQMDYYVDVMTKGAINAGATGVYGNWHSTISDCYVAFGLLTDDKARYQKGIDLYKATVPDYFRWGKGAFAQNRLPGEATETLRDIYHTQFGLGGLIQVAEAAWQQNQDLYSVGDYALVAALEVHARIINAGNLTNLLPPGFRFYESMPPPPPGTWWQFDIRSQLWYAKDTATGAVVATQTDGIKYVVGSKWLPTAWEVAYNHFAGRLGMELLETQKLLRRHWPEHHEFHWGQGTLTHADTATMLWQWGVNGSTVCANPSG